MTGASLTMERYVYKWKNHFYEVKGDVGMSLHEKERNKKMPTPRHKVTHNPIRTSLFLPILQRTRSDTRSTYCIKYILPSYAQRDCLYSSETTHHVRLSYLYIWRPGHTVLCNAGKAIPYTVHTCAL